MGVDIMTPNVTKLAIGTVQFGLPYGIANRNGQVANSTIKDILHHARLVGIDTLDTAISYGESEQRLGEVGIDEWKVVTKLPGLDKACDDLSTWLNEHVYSSLSRLNVTELSGILLHRPNQLLEPNGKLLWSLLHGLKQDGVVTKVGFSIYDPSQLDQLWHSFRPDIVQAPYNILDRRLSTSGWMERMSDAGVEIHIRSIFLQGLLLMDKKERPKQFDYWRSIMATWDKWLYTHGITAQQGCLSFAMSNPYISKAIVGVDTLNQLKQILNVTDIYTTEFPQSLSTTDLNLINPSNWNNP